VALAGGGTEDLVIFSHYQSAARRAIYRALKVITTDIVERLSSRRLLRVAVDVKIKTKVTSRKGGDHIRRHITPSVPPLKKETDRHQKAVPARQLIPYRRWSRQVLQQGPNRIRQHPLL